jgi:hypothetical protein
VNCAAVLERMVSRWKLDVREYTKKMGQIEANQGWPLSSTSVTVGVNKVMGAGSSAQRAPWSADRSLSVIFRHAPTPNIQDNQQDNKTADEEAGL